MFDTILAITVQHLDDVDRIALAIIPVQFADLFLVVEEVQPALAAAATTSTDLTDAVRGDGDFIDLVFGEGLSAVVGVVEFTTIMRYQLVYKRRVSIECSFNEEFPYPSMTVCRTVISPFSRWSRMWKETHWSSMGPAAGILNEAGQKVSRKGMCVSMYAVML